MGVQSDGLEAIASSICNSNDLSESNPGGRCMTVVDAHDSRWGGRCGFAKRENALPASCGSACLHAP